MKLSTLSLATAVVFSLQMSLDVLVAGKKIAIRRLSEGGLLKSIFIIIDGFIKQYGIECGILNSAAGCFSGILRKIFRILTYFHEKQPKCLAISE